MDAILDYKRKKEDDFYALLGCDELSSTEQILTEYKIRAKNLHPDKNITNNEAHKNFAHLQRAKEILCDASLRAKYDQWRRSEIAITFDDWLSKQDLVHMSMHWAGQKPKKHMLEDSGSAEAGKEQQKTDVSRESTGENLEKSSIRERFRNYQI